MASMKSRSVATAGSSVGFIESNLRNWLPGLGNAVLKDGEVLPYRLQIDKPGILTNLSLNETTRRDPESQEIEIQVKAGGINFRDVMKALGMYPGNPVDLKVVWGRFFRSRDQGRFGYQRPQGRRLRGRHGTLLLP